MADCKNLFLEKWSVGTCGEQLGDYVGYICDSEAADSVCQIIGTFRVPVRELFDKNCSRFLFAAGLYGFMYVRNCESDQQSIREAVGK